MTETAPTTTADDDVLRAATIAELAALAAALEPLPDAAWDAPSLCAGWRTREVVAHLTMAARYSPTQFEGELRESSFDFTALSNRIADRDGAVAPAALLDDLRSEAMQQWAPPGGGWTGALTHVVVHGLDVTVPLGLDHRPPDATLRAVLDGLTAGGPHTPFGRDLSGTELRAADIDWTHGAGRPLAAPAPQLILALTGRTVPGVELPAAPG